MLISTNDIKQAINEAFENFRKSQVFSNEKAMTSESKKHICERYMSDDDIAAQYDDFQIEYLELQPSRFGEGYDGTIEIAFPNVDHDDFDNYVVDNFMVYDNDFTRFGFDNWYPDEVVEELKQIIRDYAIENDITNNAMTSESKKHNSILISESFNIKNGKMKKKDGLLINIAYIDSRTSDSTYQYKDIIKNKFNGAWFPSLKTWGWFLGNNPEAVYHTKIKPCLEWLDKQINDNRNVIELIDKLIKEVGSNGVVTNKEDITERLRQFKEELIAAVSSEEFKAKMEPVIKFKLAQGHKFSFLNALLVLAQDPKATLVKSKKNWLNFNREVETKAPAIWLWIPTHFTPYSQEKKDEITQRFLKRYKVSSVKELHPGVQEELKTKLSGQDPRRFELGPYFFDVRFTKQISGTEDLVGKPSDDDIPWFSDSEDETDQTKTYFDALMEVVTGYGIKVDYADDLGGARGVSSNGKITLLANQPKNTGMVNTFIHEFSHELLHQKYMQSNNPEVKEFFVGNNGDRPRIEQQAELCAWIVMRNYGYDMPTNINYVGLWGLNKDNAVDVFDSVAKVAQFIVTKMNSKLGMVTESKTITESFLPDGEELANMLGYGKLYRQAEEEKENEDFEETDDNVEDNVDTVDKHDEETPSDTVEQENEVEDEPIEECSLKNILKESYSSILKNIRN